eukprot:GHUV01026469.1.p1 GENE.GHUV01026469.1~~GHUV01026469.1.p1  ORF type:complete len:251 (+),score=33.30 GHUV01026469.1:373-1125(+)
MNELLDWFTKASTVQQLPDFPEGDTRAVLSLPSAVSKYERAKWHSAAQRAGLDSASQGVGADRFLQISPRPLLHPPASADPAASSGTHSTETHNSNRVHHSSVKDTAGSCSWRQKRAADASGTDTALAADSSDAWPPEGRSGSAKPNKPFKPRHKQVWDWCQLEGGAFWNYSQGEIRELLNSGGQMPPELQQIIQKRCAHLRMGVVHIQVAIINGSCSSTLLCLNQVYLARHVRYTMLACLAQPCWVRPN